MMLTLHIGDCLAELRKMADQSVNCCVTSPPYYGLRDYGHEGQIGLEETPEAYVAKMVEVFREVRRVLRDDGTLWLNLGDSYAANRGGTTPPAQTVAGGVGGRGGDKERRGMKDGYNPSRDPKAHGLKHKDLIGIPWRVAFALQGDGWYLRQDIIWHKPNPMPESVKDRCTKAHEYVFMLSKSAQYFYDGEAIKEPAKYAGLTGQDASGFKDAKKFNGKHADKQRGRRLWHAGFNERWDAMSREEQCSGMRNKRSVWEVATRPFAGAHFATFPPALIEPCVLAGCPKGGVVLDPFGGSGTTAGTAIKHGRKAVLIELNPAYAAMTKRRISEIAGDVPDMFREAVQA